MAKMTIYELLAKTYYEEYSLRKYGAAVSLYFTDLNMRKLDTETIKQLVSVIIAYLFETDTNPTFIEKFETRVHARRILKKLLRTPWYMPILFWRKQFEFKDWLAGKNWTSVNMTPHVLLGLHVKPTFWIDQVDVKSTKIKDVVTHHVELRALEVCGDITPVEIPFEITSFGI